MGPVLVVVLDELVEQSVGLALVRDQGAVEEFAADGAYSALSEGVGLWSSWRNGGHFRADGGRHLVEGAAVLGGSGAGGVGRNTGEAYESGADVD